MAASTTAIEQGHEFTPPFVIERKVVGGAGGFVEVARPRTLRDALARLEREVEAKKGPNGRRGIPGMVWVLSDSLGVPVRGAWWDQSMGMVGYEVDQAKIGRLARKKAKRPRVRQQKARR